MTEEDFGRIYQTYHWKFLSIKYSFQDIGWKLYKKKNHFSSSKGNNSYKESSDNFDSHNCLRPYNKGHYSNWKNLAIHNSFGNICEKLMSDPFVLFLVMAAMFFFFMDKKSPHQFYVEYPKEHPNQFWFKLVKNIRYLKGITLKIAKIIEKG